MNIFILRKALRQFSELILRRQGEKEEEPQEETANGCSIFLFT
jgi:hypothetical protein